MYSLTFVSQQKNKFKSFSNALMDYPQLGEIHEAQSLWKFIPFIPTAIGNLDMVIIDLTHELTWDMTMSMVKFKMMHPHIELVALVDKTNINFIMSCINYGATGLLLWNPHRSQALADIVFQALKRKGTPLSPSLAKLLIRQFHHSKQLESQSA
jgi:DNA-binding NarL/FixJ family response regulator